MGERELENRPEPRVDSRMLRWFRPRSGSPSAPAPLWAVRLDGAMDLSGAADGTSETPPSGGELHDGATEALGLFCRMEPLAGGAVCWRPRRPEPVAS